MSGQSPCRLCSPFFVLLSLSSFWVLLSFLFGCSVVVILCVSALLLLLCVLGGWGGGEGGRNSFWVHKQKETKKEEVYLTLTRYTL